MKASCAMPHSVSFVQGLLLPLCQSGSCTLREAVIVSSVINRTSIPVVHSAAALLRLAEMPYSGTTSFFIRVLLDKKYSMPYRVVSRCCQRRQVCRNGPPHRFVVENTGICAESQMAVPVNFIQSLHAVSSTPSLKQPGFRISVDNLVLLLSRLMH